MQIVLCDDEVLVLNQYETCLREVCAKHGISVIFRKYKSGEQLLFFAEEIVRDVDIVFIDIRMPGIDGIETARKLRAQGYEGELIFLTHSREDVFSAFDVRATNYLLKDRTSLERLESVFLRSVEQANERHDEYLLLTGVGEYRNIPVADIRYFEIQQKIVTVYYGSTSFEFVSTMGKLENLLFAKGFLRISRSYLVAVRHVAAFTYERVVTTAGEELPVGRKYYKALKEAVKGTKNEE